MIADCVFVLNCNFIIPKEQLRSAAEVKQTFFHDSSQKDPSTSWHKHAHNNLFAELRLFSGTGYSDLEILKTAPVRLTTYFKNTHKVKY